MHHKAFISILYEPAPRYECSGAALSLLLDGYHKTLPAQLFLKQVLIQAGKDALQKVIALQLPL